MAILFNGCLHTYVHKYTCKYVHTLSLHFLLTLFCRDVCVHVGSQPVLFNTKYKIQIYIHQLIFLCAIYQKGGNFTKCPKIPNGHKTYQYFLHKPRLSKIYQTRDLGLKIYHLATLLNTVLNKNLPQTRWTTFFLGWVYLPSRWPNEFVKKITQNVAQPIFVKMAGFEPESSFLCMST
jgi:hypothetical protein